MYIIWNIFIYMLQDYLYILQVYIFITEIYSGYNAR